MWKFLSRFFKPKEDRTNFNGLVFVRFEVTHKEWMMPDKNRYGAVAICRNFSRRQHPLNDLNILTILTNSENALVILLKYEGRILKESEIVEESKFNGNLGSMYHIYGK